MNSELEKINSPVLLDLKIRTYNGLAKSANFSKKSELLLASLLKIHYDKCTEVDTCPCRKREFIYDPKKNDIGNKDILQFHKDDVFVKHFILKLCKEGIAKFKDSKLLYLDYLYYQFESLRIYPPILSMIQSFRKKFQNNIDFSIDFCLYRLAAKLNKFIEQKNEKNAISDTLLIENVQTYDRGMKLIKEEVMGVTKLFKQMWEVLKDPLPNLNAILEICSENFQKINDVNGLYSSLIVINNNSFELKVLMDIYCSHIIYDELMSAQVNKDIQLANPMEVGISIKQDIDYLRKKYNIYDQKTAVISISSNLENMNQIIWASKNSLNIFGVSEAQIIGTSINEWMPSCYAQVHDQILNNFFKTGREVKINNIMHTFALDNQSLCYSTNMMVKIIPSIQNYEMMALFHKLNQDDYFITFNDGTISSVGKTFRKLIDIDPKFLRKNRLNIQLFVPKILPIFQDYFEDHTDESSKEPLIKNDTRYREFLGAQEGIEIKFYFFIPINMEKYIKQQVELKGQFQKDFQQQAQQYKDSKQRSVAFKEKYHEYLIKGINQHTPRRLSKLIRFKCLVLEDRYYNGVKNQSSFIFKIISHEEKFLNQEQMVKMKKQQNILKKYCKALKISHDKAKTQSKQEEKEIDQQDEEGDAKQINSDQQKEKKKVSNVFNIIGRLKNGRRASNLRGNKQGLLFGDKNGGTDKQNDQSENEKKDNKEPELTEEEKQQQQQKNAIQTILLLMKGQNTNPYITIGVQQKMEWVSEEYVKKQNEDKKSFQRSGTNQIDIIGTTDNNSNKTVSRESLRFNQRKNSRLGSRKLSFMNQKSIQSLDLKRINYQNQAQVNKNLDKRNSQNLHMSTIQSQDINRQQSSYLNYQKEAKEDLEKFREMQMLQEQELQQKQNDENQGAIQSLSSLQNSINTDSLKQKNNNGSQESNILNSGSNQDNLDGEKRKTKKKKKLRDDDELPVIPIFRRMKELLLNPENKLGCQLGQRDYSYFKDYKKFSQARDEKEIQKQSIFQFGGNINNDDIDEVDSQEDNQNDQLLDQVNLKSSRIDKINNSDSIQQQLNKQESLRNNKGSLLKNSLKREPQNSTNIQNKWKFLGNKFQLNQKKQGNQQQDMANSSSSDGEGDEHQQLLLESVNSHQRGFDQDLIGENKKVNFLELLQKKEFNEVGHAGSISSSIQSSLNTQNALRILRNSLKTYKTDLILMLANFVVIGMCFVLSVLGFWHFFSLSGKINTFENYLFEVERIAIYSENITLFYNNYQDLKLFANDYYDQSEILSVYPNWVDELQSYTKDKLQTFQTFSLNDLSNAGTSDNDLRAYLFEQISTTMLIKSEESKLTLNYQNFVRLYNNAVNQTVGLDLNGYTLNEYKSNDYLYLINENYDSQTKQNEENMTKIQNEIESLINSMLTMYYILWGLSLFVIVGSFLTIYPIMLQSKIKTHESLTMFTFVSLIDVDFYHDHYRQILNYLGNIDSSNDLLQVVEKFITDETIQLAKQKKKQDIKNLSRSRQYKDIDQNKILLFVRLFILLACYVLINFAKDFNMVYFIIRSKDLANLDIKQHQLYYLSQKNLVDYKQILFDFINGDNLDDFEDLVLDFQKNCPTNITKLIQNNYYEFGLNLNDDYSDFIQLLVTQDLCSSLLNLQTSELENCQQYGNGMLKKGYENFILEYEKIMIQGLDSVLNIYQKYSYNKAKTSAYGELQDERLRDYNKMMEYINQVQNLWYQIEKKTLIDKYNQKKITEEVLLIVIQVMILLFLICIWRGVYLKMIKNSKWVNSFILLIPMNLLRENQYLKSYLRRKLKINTMMN